MAISVYYLDDESHLCDMFKEYLERVGVDTTTFTEPAAAIEACKISPPSIMFIDYRLSSTTGDVVANSISDGVLKVLVTGDLARGTPDGFVTVLKKPFRMAAVRELIRTLCEDP